MLTVSDGCLLLRSLSLSLLPLSLSLSLTDGTCAGYGNGALSSSSGYGALTADYINLLPVSWQTPFSLSHFGLF